MTPELEKYIESHISPEPETLRDLHRKTNLRLLNGRMSSGHLQGRLLKMLVTMIKPRRVLELGTFSGYSALCIAEALDEGASLDTIEIDDELEDLIRSNFNASPYGDRIRLHIGDAEHIVTQWTEETFDLIFMDTDKRRYSEDYLLCLPLLRKGGYILADNTLWGEAVVNPDKSRDRQTRGILDFNRMVADDPRVEKVILPIRDGLTIIRKL